MRLSPDAILFGLDLLREKALLPSELGGFLRAAAAAGGSDQLVAVQEAVLDRRPDLARQLGQLDAAPPYVLFDCKGCRRMFRARPDQVGPAAYCPLCGEAIVTDRSLLFLADWVAPQARAAEAPSEPYALSARRRFAHFELIGLIGRGGAGKVYEARNRRVGRVVALKLLDFQPLESVAETFRRLKRESRVAATVVHDNIVRVLDLGVAESVPFVEMELIRGSSLSKHVREQGPMAPGEACAIVMGALAGLARVHQEQIVHGDVKPGNILIDERGRARLTDFGISKFLEETTSLGAPGKLVGSPHFMAPEQWRGEALSVRTDLYAMGLVLYYAITGRLPYEGQIGPTLMFKHLQEPLLEPGRHYAGLPDHAASVIRRATEKDQAGRFQSAEEFSRALGGFAEEPRDRARI